MSMTHYPIVLLPPKVAAVQAEPELDIPQLQNPAQIQPLSQVDLGVKQEQWKDLAGLVGIGVVGLATTGVLAGLGSVGLGVLAFVASFVGLTGRCIQILKRLKYQY